MSRIIPLDFFAQLHETGRIDSTGTDSPMGTVPLGLRLGLTVPVFLHTTENSRNPPVFGLFSDICFFLSLWPIITCFISTADH